MAVQELGNGKYRVIICNGRLPNGKVNRMTKTVEARSLAAARKIEKELEYEFKHGKIEKTKEKDYRFDELVEKWRELRSESRSPRTVDRYENMIEGHLLPRFGRWNIKDIRPLDIEEFLKFLTKDGARLDKKSGGYSDKTVQSYFLLINVLLNLGVMLEMIERNVCEKVEMPKVIKKESAYYNGGQVIDLLNSIDKEEEALKKSLAGRNPNHRFLTDERIREIAAERKYTFALHKTFIYMALATAARRSELCGLEWSDIDFEFYSLRICRTVQYSNRIGSFERPCLKNGSPIKTMFIPENVMKVLLELKEEQERYKAVIGDKWIDSRKVFTALDGNLIHPNNISVWFKRLLKKYNLPYITLHQLRHTGLSFLVNMGVEMQFVSDHAGHSDITVTDRIYGHMYEASKRKTAEYMGKMFDR